MDKPRGPDQKTKSSLMSYKIFYSSQSQKYLLRLTGSKSSSVLKRIENIVDNPFKIDNNIVKLVGTISSYRARIGDIRIIYQLDHKTKSIFVAKIAPRGSAYSF